MWKSHRQPTGHGLKSLVNGQTSGPYKWPIHWPGSHKTACLLVTTLRLVWLPIRSPRCRRDIQQMLCAQVDQWTKAYEWEWAGPGCSLIPKYRTVYWAKKCRRLGLHCPTQLPLASCGYWAPEIWLVWIDMCYMYKIANISKNENEKQEFKCFIINF